MSICYSDNGNNFVGCANMLAKIDWAKVEKETSCTGIVWKRIPPASPWWGGWWERMFRVLKDMLKKQLGKSSLDFEELNTLVCDAEAFINMRPLTYVGEDEMMPITPAHFLGDIKSLDTPNFEFMNTLHFSKRIRYVAKIREELKTRFKKEYLANLVRYRRLSNMKGNKLKVGEIVLISNDNSKRLLWPLARIIKFYPGKDGENRVALLKTSKGDLVRPVQRLCSMEIGFEDMEEVALMDGASIPISKVSSENQSVCQSKKKTEAESLQTRKGRLLRKPKRYED